MKVLQRRPFLIFFDLWCERIDLGDGWKTLTLNMLGWWRRFDVCRQG